MVKVINIDTKTRTIRVENAADGDIKTWRTTESGAHFPIKKGESTKEALDKFVEKKRPESKKESGASDGSNIDGRKVRSNTTGTSVEVVANRNGMSLQGWSHGGVDYVKDGFDANKFDEKTYKSMLKDISDAVRSYDKQVEAALDKYGFKASGAGESGKINGRKIDSGATGTTVELSLGYDGMSIQGWSHGSVDYKNPKFNYDDLDESTYKKVIKDVADASSAYDNKITSIMGKYGFKKKGDGKTQQPAKPSKKADVSDIIKSYKEKMAALGPKASIKKTDRVEADAIKEFMTRKLGANRPYEDYYQYWLNGMDKKTREEFEEIYNESEAREMAFSELASDVDHSGLARGEPTYDELMQWAEKQKAKKAESDRLAKEADEFEKTTKRDRERQQRKEHTEWTRNTLTDDEAEAIDIIRKWKRGEIGDDEFMNIGKRLKESAIKTIKK